MNSLSQWAPEKAVAWIDALTDETAKVRCKTSLAQSWIRTDPPTAKAWISRSGLPADVVETILKAADSATSTRSVFVPGEFSFGNWE